MRRIAELDENRTEIENWIEGMADGMKDSAICLSIFTDNYKAGIDSLLQFAVAIMLDKPVFLLVPDSVKIPERVRRVADGIERFKDGDTADMQRAAERLLHSAKEKGFTA